MPYAVNVDGLGEIEVPDNASEIDMLQKVLIEKAQAGIMSPNDAKLQEISGLIQQMGIIPELPEPSFEEGPPRRGWWGEAGAAIAAGALGTYADMLSGTEAAAEAYGFDKDRDDGMLKRAGADLGEYVKGIEMSPDKPEVYWKLFNAFGSLLGFAAPAVTVGVAAPVLGAGALLTGGLATGLAMAMGTGAGAGEQYRRAVLAGATPAQLDKAVRWGWGIGSSEAMPLFRAINVARRLGKGTLGKISSKDAPDRPKNDGVFETLSEEARQKGKGALLNKRVQKQLGIDVKPFQQYALGIGKQFGLEGSQEFLAAVAQNATEKHIYNPDVDVWNTEAIEEGLYGGSAGAMLEGIVGVFGTRKSRAMRRNMKSFLETDEYKGLRDEAVEASNDFERAEERLQGVPAGTDPASPLATELQSQKNDAEVRFNRANEMMTRAMRDGVYNTKEIRDYLAEETDENGERIYSEAFLNAALNQRNLKEVYINHVQNPRTKYQSDTEDILYGLIDPKTGINYTYDEVESVRKSFEDGTSLAPSWKGEVNARQQDAKEGLPTNVQIQKADARVKHGVSQSRLSQIQKQYGNTVLFNYLDLLQQEGELTDAQRDWKLDKKPKAKRRKKKEQEVYDKTQATIKRKYVNTALRRAVDKERYDSQGKTNPRFRQWSKERISEFRAKAGEEYDKRHIKSVKFVNKLDNILDTQGFIGLQGLRAEIAAKKKGRVKGEKLPRTPQEAVENIIKDRNERVLILAKQMAAKEGVKLEAKHVAAARLEVDVAIKAEAQEQSIDRREGEEVDPDTLLSAADEVAKKRHLEWQKKRKAGTKRRKAGPGEMTIDSVVDSEEDVEGRAKDEFNALLTAQELTDALNQEGEGAEGVVDESTTETSSGILRTKEQTAKWNEKVRNEVAANLEANKRKATTKTSNQGQLLQSSEATAPQLSNTEIQTVNELFAKEYTAAYKRAGRRVDNEDGQLAAKGLPLIMKPFEALESLKNDPTQTFENELQRDLMEETMETVDKSILQSDSTWSDSTGTRSHTSPTAKKLQAVRQTLADDKAANPDGIKKLWLENPKTNEKTVGKTVISYSINGNPPVTQLPDGQGLLNLEFVSEEKIRETAEAVMLMVSGNSTKSFTEGRDESGNIIYTNNNPEKGGVTQIRFMRVWPETDDIVIQAKEDLAEEIKGKGREISSTVLMTLEIIDKLQEAQERGSHLILKYNPDYVGDEQTDGRGGRFESEFLGSNVNLSGYPSFVFNLTGTDTTIEQAISTLERESAEETAARNARTLEQAILVAQFNVEGKFDGGQQGENPETGEIDLENYGLMGDLRGVGYQLDNFDETWALEHKDKPFSPSMEGGFQEGIGEEGGEIIINVSGMERRREQYSESIAKDEAELAGRTVEEYVREHNRSSSEEEIQIEIEEAESDLGRLKNMVNNWDLWVEFLKTNSHEAWHAIRALLLTADQLKFFNENVTVALAEENGFDKREFYEMDWEKQRDRHVLNDRNQVLNDGLTKWENGELQTNENGFFVTEAGQYNPETKESISNEEWMRKAEEEFAAGWQTKEDRVLDEAQAYMFMKWYVGDILKGVSAQSRRFMDRVRSFLNGLAESLKAQGILVTAKQIPNIWRKHLKAPEHQIAKMYEDIKSGKLAQQTAKLPAPNAASHSAQRLPENISIVRAKDKIREVFNIGTPAGLGGNGGTSDSAIEVPDDPGSGIEAGEKIMKDLTGFARIVAHISAIAEGSIPFKNFYNKVQERVQYRNAMKMVADVFAEHIGKFGGLFKLNKVGVKAVQDLHIVTDMAGVDPVFTNVGQDNATATISFTEKEVEQIAILYDMPVDEEGRVSKEDYLTGFGEFLNDAGVPIEAFKINPNARRTDTYTDKDGTVRAVDVDYVSYEMTVTDPQIASAFAGSHAAIQHIGDEKYKAIVHNLLNTGKLKGVGELLQIRTGRDVSYKEMQQDIRDLFSRLRTEGFIKGRMPAESIDEGTYRKHVEARDLMEKLVGEDPDTETAPDIMGGLNVKQASELFQILNAVANEKRSGYFPHYRHGDRAIAVYKKKLDSKGEVVKGDLVRMETAESNMADKLGKVPIIGDSLNRRIKRKQREIAEELHQQYGENYIISTFDMTLDNVRRTDDGKAILQAMGTLESMATIFQGKDYRSGGGRARMDVMGADEIGRFGEEGESGKETVVDKFVEMIKERTSLSRAQTLLKERKNYPGYINSRNNDGTYFKQSFQRFVDSGSNIASSLMIEPDILNSMEELEKIYGTASNYVDVARRTFEYINNPRNEATLLRSYAFHWFLGLNFSSAAVNLTQTVQATVPILSSITGITRGTGDVIKAGKDTTRLFRHMLRTGDQAPRLGKYGFEFFRAEMIPDPDDPDGVRMKAVDVIDMRRKPDWMAEDEFIFLANLFKEGVIQPIQNMDLGAGELSKRLNSRALRFLADSSGYAFGLVENTNRITAALAFYRAAKRPSIRDKFNAYARGTRMGEVDPASLATQQEESYTDPITGEEKTRTIFPFAEKMGAMGVEKTQFFMGKENRPMIFRGPVMSVVSQFQSFLWQMVGLYADASNKALGFRLNEFSEGDQQLMKSMARKQLAMMTLTMMAFGGAMGLPFMENFKEIWKLITEHFGDEVGEDLEQGMREVLGPILGYNATDMFLRGLPRGMQIDVSRRTGYGSVLPLRLLSGGDPTDYTGPAVSRILDTIEGINTAWDRGDAFGVAFAMGPIALGNWYRATITENVYGTFTQRGQQLLPPGSLSMGETVAYMLGFTPTNIARARERRGQENYYQYRAANGKEYYTQRMATAWSAYLTAMQEGDIKTAMEKLQQYNEDYQAAMAHDLDEMGNPSKQYNVNPESVQKRATRAHEAMTMAMGPRVRKKIRPQLQDLIQKGAVATGTG